MKIKLWISLILMMLICAGQMWAQEQVTAARQGSKINVYINDQFFARYVFSEDEKYPFFYPVNGPSGGSVVSMRTHPYPHHSGLFLACDRVNGGNYWQEGLERGRIKSVRAEIIESEGEQVILENECVWARPGANAPIKDFRRITISAPSEEMFQIDFDITLQMLEDVEIKKTGHSLFSGRMDPDLAEINGGTIVNASGDRNEEGTRSKPTPWIDYYGERGDQIEGMAIMQHPMNRWFSTPWFTREYGFFSPDPMWNPEDGESRKFKEGEKIKLHYRVLIHSGDHETAGIAEQFEEYKSEQKQ